MASANMRIDDVTTYDCPNSKNGCAYVGQLADLEAHLKRCGTARGAEKKVPVDRDDNSKLDDLLRQMAIFNQRFESMQRTVDEIKNKQEKNWAEVNGKWAEVDRRLDQLPEVPTEQTCSTQRPKTELDLKMFNRVIKPENLRLVDEYYKEKQDYTWIAKGVRKLLSGSTKELSSDVFPLRGYPFSAQAKLQLSNELVVFHWFYVHDKKKALHPVEMMPLARIFLTLRDRSNNAKDIVNTYSFQHAQHVQYNTLYFFNLQRVNVSHLHSLLYKAEDSVAIDVHVEGPEVARSVFSYDGSLTWAVDEYRKRKLAEVARLKASHSSPYFYTGEKGYRVQAEVYLNGGRAYKGRGLTVCVVFLAGPHDHDLPRSFPHQTTVTVFHPQQPTNSIINSVDTDIKKHLWYAIDVGTHQQVEKLLYEDTLHYTLTIRAKQTQQ